MGSSSKKVIMNGRSRSKDEEEMGDLAGVMNSVNFKVVPREAGDPDYTPNSRVLPEAKQHAAEFCRMTGEIERLKAELEAKDSKHAEEIKKIQEKADQTSKNVVSPKLRESETRNLTLTIRLDKEKKLMASKQDELDLLQRRIQTLENKNAACESEKAALQEKLAIAEGKSDPLQKILSLEKANLVQEQKLGELTTVTENLQKELEAAKSELQTNNLNSTLVISKLEESLKAEKEESATLKLKLDTSTETVAILQNKLTLKDAECLALKNDLKLAEQGIKQRDELANFSEDVFEVASQTELKHTQEIKRLEQSLKEERHEIKKLEQSLKEERQEKADAQANYQHLHDVVVETSSELVTVIQSLHSAMGTEGTAFEIGKDMEVSIPERLECARELVNSRVQGFQESLEVLGAKLAQLSGAVGLTFVLLDSQNTSGAVVAVPSTSAAMEPISCVPEEMGVPIVVPPNLPGVQDPSSLAIEPINLLSPDFPALQNLQQVAHVHWLDVAKRQEEKHLWYCVCNSDNHFQSRKCFRKHLAECRDTWNIQCLVDSCQPRQRFKELTHLKAHCLKAHNVRLVLRALKECRKCGRSFNSWNQLYFHRRVFHVVQKAKGFCRKANLSTPKSKVMSKGSQKKSSGKQKAALRISLRKCQSPKSSKTRWNIVSSTVHTSSSGRSNSSMSFESIPDETSSQGAMSSQESDLPMSPPDHINPGDRNVVFLPSDDLSNSKLPVIASTLPNSTIDSDTLPNAVPAINETAATTATAPPPKDLPCSTETLPGTENSQETFQNEIREDLAKEESLPIPPPVSSTVSVVEVQFESVETINVNPPSSPSTDIDLHTSAMPSVNENVDNALPSANTDETIIISPNCTPSPEEVPVSISQLNNNLPIAIPAAMETVVTLESIQDKVQTENGEGNCQEKDLPNELPEHNNSKTDQYLDLEPDSNASMIVNVSSPPSPNPTDSVLLLNEEGSLNSATNLPGTSEEPNIPPHSSETLGRSEIERGANYVNINRVPSIVISTGYPTVSTPEHFTNNSQILPEYPTSSSPPENNEPYHELDKSKTQEGFYCTCRDQPFEDLRSLRIHIKLKTRESKFQCDFCYKKFYSLVILKDHYARKHNDPTALQEYVIGCSKCGTKYETKEHYESHVELAHSKLPWRKEIGNFSPCISDDPVDSLSNPGLMVPPPEPSIASSSTALPLLSPAPPLLYAVKIENPSSPLSPSTSSAVLIKHRKDQSRKRRKAHYCMCGRRFKSNTYLQLHLIANSSQKKFFCSVCNEGFATTQALKNHMLKAHKLRYNKHGCRRCGAEFDTMKQLRRHGFTHKTPIVIDLTQEPQDEANPFSPQPPLLFAFDNEDPQQRPAEQRIVPGNVNESEDDSSETYSESELEHHARDVTKLGLYCTCGLEFPSVRKLDLHVEGNNAERKFECSMCNTRLVLIDDLIKHYKRVHNVIQKRLQKWHPCRYCDHFFNNKEMRRDHVRRVHLKKKNASYPWAAEVKKTAAKRIEVLSRAPVAPPTSSSGVPLAVIKQEPVDPSLLKHRTNWRRQSQGFYCICGHRARNRGALNSHLIYFALPKNFACQVCDYRFKNTSFLKKHMKEAHKMGYEFKGCTKCTRLFNSNEELKEHYRSAHPRPRRKKVADEVDLTSGATPAHPFSSGQDEQVIQPSQMSRVTTPQIQEALKNVSRPSTSSTTLPISVLVPQTSTTFTSSSSIPRSASPPPSPPKQLSKRRKSSPHAVDTSGHLDGFFWCLCGDQFESDALLNHHIKQFLPTSKLECRECKDQFMTHTQYIIHRSTHHPPVEEQVQNSESGPSSQPQSLVSRAIPQNHIMSQALTPVVTAKRAMPPATSVIPIHPNAQAQSQAQVQLPPRKRTYSQFAPTPDEYPRPVSFVAPMQGVSPSAPSPVPCNMPPPSRIPPKRYSATNSPYTSHPPLLHTSPVPMSPEMVTPSVLPLINDNIPEITKVPVVPVPSTCTTLAPSSAEGMGTPPLAKVKPSSSSILQQSRGLHHINLELVGNLCNCGKEYPNHEELKQHIMRHTVHSNSKMLNTPNLSVTPTTPQASQGNRIHKIVRRNSSSDSRWMCFCNEEFADQESIQGHIRNLTPVINETTPPPPVTIFSHSSRTYTNPGISTNARQSTVDQSSASQRPSIIVHTTQQKSMTPSSATSARPSATSTASSGSSFSTVHVMINRNQNANGSKKYFCTCGREYDKKFQLRSHIQRHSFSEEVSQNGRAKSSSANTAVALDRPPLLSPRPAQNSLPRDLSTPWIPTAQQASPRRKTHTVVNGQVVYNSGGVVPPERPPSTKATTNDADDDVLVDVHLSYEMNVNRTVDHRKDEEKAKEGKYFCTCELDCFTPSKLNSHIAYYDSRRKFICVTCKTGLCNIGSFRRHLQQAHSINYSTSNECKLCREVFPTKMEQYQHFRTVHEPFEVEMKYTPPTPPSSTITSEPEESLNQIQNRNVNGNGAAGNGHPRDI